MSGVYTGTAASGDKHTYVRCECGQSIAKVTWSLTLNWWRCLWCPRPPEDRDCCWIGDPCPIHNPAAGRETP